MARAEGEPPAATAPGGGAGASAALLAGVVAITIVAVSNFAAITALVTSSQLPARANAEYFRAHPDTWREGSPYRFQRRTPLDHISPLVAPLQPIAVPMALGGLILALVALDGRRTKRAVVATVLNGALLLAVVAPVVLLALSGQGYG